MCVQTKTITNECDFLSGVPPGNALEQLLLNLLINDDLPLYVHIFLFADDCKISNSFPKHNSGVNSIQTNLNFINGFCLKMQMQASVDAMF